jgi:hypothetical protein
MRPQNPSRRAGLTGGVATIGAAALAFIASQHHNVHMLLIALGVGGAGSTFMQTYPWARRLMLLVSIGVVAVNVTGLRRSTVPKRTRGVVLVFSALTIVIVIWSAVRFGL